MVGGGRSAERAQIESELVAVVVESQGYLEVVEM